MAYTATISVPVVFDAASDAEARIRLQEVTFYIAQNALKHELGEITDAPGVLSFDEVLPYEAPRPVLVDDDEDVDVFVTADGYRLQHAWDEDHPGVRVWTDGNLTFASDEFGWPVDATDATRVEGHFLSCTCLPGQAPHEPGCQLWRDSSPN